MNQLRGLDIAKVQVLLRDPSSYITDEATGTETELVPDEASLTWHEIKFALDPDECFPDDRTLADQPHSETVCPDCVESWSCDYYFRIYTSANPDQPLFDTSPGGADYQQD